MKLYYILITIISVIVVEFVISIALDSVWVSAQIARQIIIYLAMLSVLYVGYMVYNEILKS